MMSRSLTLRITLRFAALVTATTIIVLAAGGWLLDAQMQRGLVIIQQTEVSELLDKLSGATADPESVRERILRDSQGDAGLFLIQVHDHLGRVLFRSENLGSAYLPDLPQADTGRKLTLPGVGDLYMTETRSADWHIQVASPLSAQRRLLRDYARVSAALVAGVALLSLGLGYGFSRVILEPLREIARTARQIGADNLKSRIPVTKVRDELTDLAGLLNAMFDRLEASFQQVRRFAGDASHELKTPLAIMRLNADKVRTRLAADPQALAALDDWLEEQARLSRVIDRLLFLAKAEGGALPLNSRPLDPCMLLRDIAEDAAVLAEDKNVRFELGPCPLGELRGDAELLRQLFLNLVSNALQVSPPGSQVRLSAELGAGGWTLAVEDEGPGLPEPELLRIFERFARHGHGTSSAHGHGLGLAICQSIAALHGGTIRAENRTDRSGLRVTVTLPG
jgi:signal transduction histidine kinase